MLNIFKSEKEAATFLKYYAMPFILEDDENIDDNTPDLLDIYDKLEEKCLELSNINIEIKMRKLHESLVKIWKNTHYQENKKLNESINNTAELQSFLQILIHNAINPDSNSDKEQYLIYQDNNGNRIQYNQDLKKGFYKRIKEDLFDACQSLCCENIGNCYLLDEPIRLTSLKLVEIVTVTAIFKCLYSTFDFDKFQEAIDGKKSNEKNRLMEEHSSYAMTGEFKESLSAFVNKGIGFQIVGCCLECKKLFIKTRKDQIYCSHKCKNAYVTRRLRKEKRAS